MLFRIEPLLSFIATSRIARSIGATTILTLRWGPVSGLGSKMGLDATSKWPAETQGQWDRPIVMDRAVAARMESVFESLGV